MIARLMRQCRPMSTWVKMMLESISAYEFTRTSCEITLLRTTAPETMQPCETIEFTAIPVRPGSPKTNFAGGYCRCRVRSGQLWSYQLKIGDTDTTSM